MKICMYQSWNELNTHVISAVANSVFNLLLSIVTTFCQVTFKLGMLTGSEAKKSLIRFYKGVWK